MRKVLGFTMLAAGLICLGSSTARAEGVVSDQPLWTLARVQVGAGLNYEWVDRVSDSAPQVGAFSKEWTAGLYGAYNLVPARLDAVGFTKLGLDTHLLNSALGLRLVLFTGGQGGN